MISLKVKNYSKQELQRLYTALVLACEMTPPMAGVTTQDKVVIDLNHAIGYLEAILESRGVLYHE